MKERANGDNQVITTAGNIENVKQDMKIKLEIMVKWLRNSGLVVNESKTELCLFHKSPQLPINLKKLNCFPITLTLLYALFASLVPRESKLSAYNRSE